MILNSGLLFWVTLHILAMMGRQWRHFVYDNCRRHLLRLQCVTAV